MMIEKDTTYAYYINHLENISFDKIQILAKKFINELPDCLQTELYNELERGIDILTTESQMQMYLYAYGRMHKAKLNYAFSEMDSSVWEYDEIAVVDYGCGQGLATMVLVDFLREQGVDCSKIINVTLIEPSERCLQRAILHISKFLPNAEIKAVNKELDSIDDDDIKTNRLFAIHLLSNILDIESVSLNQLATKINKSRYLFNEIVCVGPLFSDIQRKNRMDSFCKQLKVESITSLEFQKSEWINNWSVQVRIATNRTLCNLFIKEKEDPINYLKIDEFYDSWIGRMCLWYDDEVFKGTKYTEHLSDTLKISFDENYVSEDFGDKYIKSAYTLDPNTIKHCADEFLIYKISYAYKHILDKSVTESIMDCFYKAANDGIYEAYNNIGVFYHQTDRIDNAVKYYTLAANNGSSNAMVNLSHYYYSINDFENAYRYTKSAADNDSEVGLCNLAIIYHFGLCEIAIDLELARKNYKKALEIKDNNNLQEALFNITKLELSNNEITNTTALARLENAVRYDRIKNFKAVLMAKEGSVGYLQLFKNSSNETSIYNLGVCYEYGIGCEQNADKALEYYLQTAMKNDDGNYKSTIALNIIGRLYHNKKDYKNASYWYGESFKNSDCQCAAMTNLAIVLEKTEKYKDAFKIWCDYSVTGKGCKMCHEAYKYDKNKRECPKAQYAIAENYRDGIIGKIDLENANKWALKAASQGYEAAELYIANSYAIGRGYEKNDKSAAIWFRKAAYHNAGEAQYRMFFETRDKNIIEAIRWIALAANNNIGDAQWILGLIYYKGNVIKNNKQAMFWFLKAADNNNINAQLVVGKIFTKTDKTKAKKWLLRAINQGNKEAQKEYDKLLKMENNSHLSKSHDYDDDDYDIFGF